MNLKQSLRSPILLALSLSWACGPGAMTNRDGQQDGKGLPEIPRTPVGNVWPRELHSKLQISDSALPKGVEIAEAGPRPMVSSLELRGEVVGDEREERRERAVPPDRNRVVKNLSGPVFIRVNVPVRDLADVREGQEVLVIARTLGRSESGQVASVGTIDGQTTRSAPVSIVVANPGGGRWWPGLEVTVRLIKESFAAGVAIPRSALQSIEGLPVVFVRSGEWFEVRPVSVGRADEDVVEITAGLAPGERFAAVNSDLVRRAMRKGGPPTQPSTQGR